MTVAKHGGQLSNFDRAIHRVALFIEATSSPGGYQSALWRGVADEIQAEATLLCVAGGALEHSPINKYERERNIIYDLVNSRNVNGVILSGTIATYMKDRTLEEFRHQYKDLPMVSTIVRVPGIPAVCIDDSKGMRALMNHLLDDHGYRSIAFISGDLRNPEALQRFQVYRDALEARNIRVDDNLIVSGDFFANSGAEALRTLRFERKAHFRAVVCANDNMAIGALEEAQRNGLNVPDDLAIVGFDDIAVAAITMPALTTVRQPVHQQGREAARMMLRLLRGEPVPEVKELQTELHIRQSCGCGEETEDNPLSARSEMGGDTAQRIKVIARDIRWALGDRIGQRIDGLVEELVDALCSEAAHKTHGAFGATLDGILRRSLSSEAGPYGWHEAVYLLHSKVKYCIDDPISLNRAYALLQEAQYKIGKTTQQREVYRIKGAELRSETLSEINQALVTAQSAAELADILAQGLPLLGIPACTIALYDNPEKPADGARSILLYGRQRRIEIAKGGKPLPLQELLPADFEMEDRTHSLVVEPLCFREKQLGYAVFEVETSDWDLFEFLQEQLSGVLWASVLVEKQNELLTEKTELLQSVSEMGSKLKLEEVADEILRKIKGLVAFNKASLQLVVGGIRTQLASDGFDKTTAVPWFSSVVKEDTLISRVLERDEPYILSHPSDAPEWKQELWTADVNSWIGLPLFFASEPIGLITLDHEKPGYYKPELARKLRNFAQQAAIDLTKAHQLHLAEARIEHLELVIKIGDIIAAQLETNELLQTITSEIKNRLTCTHCTVFFPSKVDGETILDPWQPLKPSESSSTNRRFKLKEGVVGWVFENGKPLLLGDAAADSRFAPSRTASRTSRSMIVVPLKTSRTIGVICADQDAKNWFTESKLRLVEAVATQAAIAIERKFGLDLIQRIGEKIASLDDMDGILHAIVGSAIELTHTTTGVIHLISDDGQSVTKTVHPPSGFQHPAPRLQLPHGLTRQTIRKGKIVLVPDATTDNRVHPAVRERFHSLICIPVKLGEQRTLGVLYLNDVAPHEFTDTEISMLKFLASQAAIAIESARLVTDGKDKLRELAGLYETQHQTTMVQEELIELMSTAHPPEPIDDMLTRFGARLEKWPGITSVSFLLHIKDGNYDLDSCAFLDSTQATEVRTRNLSAVREAFEVSGGVRFSPIVVADANPVFFITKIESAQLDIARPWLQMAELLLQFLADIGQLMITTQTLDTENEKLQRNAVSAMVSRLYTHEILNAIKEIEAWIQLARQGSRNLEPLETRVGGLRDHVSDLMSATDFTRMRRRTCVLNDELEKVLKRLNVANKRKSEGCEFRVDIIGHKPRSVFIDPSSLIAILGNLIINAKEQYAARGKHGTISIKWIERPIGAQAYVGFEVLDYAAGIGEDERKKVFDPGWTSKKEGHGLGLWIVQKLVQACSGKVELESEYGNYAKFIILYPVFE